MKDFDFRKFCQDCNGLGYIQAPGPASGAEFIGKLSIFITDCRLCKVEGKVFDLEVIEVERK